MVTGDDVVARTPWVELEHFVHGAGEIKTTVNVKLPSRNSRQLHQRVLVPQ
jgi:hypothetical protein